MQHSRLPLTMHKPQDVKVANPTHPCRLSSNSSHGPNTFGDWLSYDVTHHYQRTKCLERMSCHQEKSFNARGALTDGTWGLPYGDTYELGVVPAWTRTSTMCTHVQRTWWWMWRRAWRSGALQLPMSNVWTICTWCAFSRSAISAARSWHCSGDK